MQPNNKAPRSKINVLMLAYIAFIMVGLPTGLLGIAWPTMRADFSLPLDAMGLLLISSTVGYFLASFFIARMVNRFGIGSLLIFSCLTSAVASFGYPIAPAWSVIVGIGALAGFGGGVLDAGLNTYMAAEYKESEMQWLHAFFGLGATLSPIIMTASLSQFASWRPGYIFVGILMIMIGAAFWFTCSAWKTPQKISEIATESGEAAPGLMDYQTSVWDSLLHPQTWVGILLFLLYTGAELTLGNWTYTLFTESRGISPQIAGIWAGGFWAIFTIGRILGGLYAHRVRLSTLMISAMWLALAGSILFWWNPLPLVGVLGVFVVGFAMAPIFPGLVSSTSQRVGEHHAANTIGIQMSAASLGGALLPALAGFLAQRISLETIPVMLTVSLLGMLILYRLSMPLKTAELMKPSKEIV
ncbi:MAG TPA: MFS transporter [Anaerolineales bacterium]|nr:MFS transporter [Anaerolineales bacterium]